MSKPEEKVEENEEPFTLEDLTIRMGFFIAIAAVIPFSVIWALNLIFGLGLLYNLQTIAAVSVILIVMDNVINGINKRREPEETGE